MRLDSNKDVSYINNNNNKKPTLVQDNTNFLNTCLINKCCLLKIEILRYTYKSVCLSGGAKL